MLAHLRRHPGRRVGLETLVDVAGWTGEDPVGNMRDLSITVDAWTKYTIEAQGRGQDRTYCLYEKVHPPYRPRPPRSPEAKGPIVA